MGDVQLSINKPAFGLEQSYCWNFKSYWAAGSVLHLVLDVLNTCQKGFVGGSLKQQMTKCNLHVRYLRLFRESPYVSSATRYLESQSEQDHHSLAKI